MRRISTGIILVGVILSFAACAAIAMCVDDIAHFLSLSKGTLVQPTLALAVFAALFAILVFSTQNPGLLVSAPVHADAPPEHPLWRPLAFAFSDGILNPKAY
jgi:hypothetical protein